MIHQQGIARFGYFDARFDEAAFRNTNLKRDFQRGSVCEHLYLHSNTLLRRNLPINSGAPGKSGLTGAGDPEDNGIGVCCINEEIREIGCKEIAF